MTADQGLDEGQAFAGQFGFTERALCFLMGLGMRRYEVEFFCHLADFPFQSGLFGFQVVYLRL